jgi:signal transduction histidine kinase
MKTPSLRWRLVRQLIALQIAVSLAALLVLVGAVWVFDALVDGNGDRTTARVARLLERAPDRKLALAEGPEIRWLLAAPDWWFIAHDGVHPLSHGEVPERYRQLVVALDGIERSLLDLQDSNTSPLARFERVQTAAGPVKLIVKTRAPLRPGEVLHGALQFYLLLMAPMALFASLGFIVAVPWVVQRGLRGVTVAAKQAEDIDTDIGQRTNRLSLDAVPSELLPLVQAINRALDRLNDGYDRQERFLADAAHELRTPIATTRLRVEALPAGEGKAALLRSTQRLATLAEHLLDLQRLSLGAAHHENVELRALCEGVVADLAPLAIANRCQLGVSADVPQQFVRGDRLALERALSNLIQNAIEHGGEHCEILVVLREGSIVEVCDTGPGIPEAERERVAEAFHRLTPQGRGAGLGLHLVAEIARLHGGQLVVGATPQGGARMRLSFPSGLDRSTAPSQVLRASQTGG